VLVQHSGAARLASSYPAVRSDAKKKKPAITSAIISKIKQGTAPWRGMADGLLSLDFFLIFGAAIQKEQSRASTDLTFRLFLEQAIKRGAGIIRVAWPRYHSVFAGSARTARGLGIAGHRHSRREKLTGIRLIFERDANRNRPDALEASGGFKIDALLATVQCSVALRALAFEVDIGGQRHAATETS
jgi:hypothetical protein